MHEYTPYKDIDKAELQKDIEAIRDQIGDPTWEDFQHLLKLELWGRICTVSGVILIIVTAYFGLAGFSFWGTAVIAAILLGVGNVARWADVTHPILHGAYDKVPNSPYT